jgi:hypothetical protein
MAEDIDFKALYEQLQKENEQLRGRLLLLSNRSIWVEIFSWENIWSLLTSPYFLIGYIAGIVVTMCITWFSVIREGTN